MPYDLTITNFLGPFKRRQSAPLDRQNRRTDDKKPLFAGKNLAKRLSTNPQTRTRALG
jgi:hypothetical protein